ncbi:lipase maturation factor 1-like isoform X2 [Ahaetulla prasina]|uniref:lipase maturation factor 1-like isoform X2 n=1 Tax=Ahaetulla prasina TaxID=499056 RepID=UPI002648790A|nr:lipase maturation factor 1-like isoform X2 [Ahaetulla prasina]
MAASEGELRRRWRGGGGGPAGDAPDPREPRAPPAPPLRPGSFWLTRLVLLRATAFIYSVAFLVGYHQNKALIGDRGLLPCKLYLESVKRHFKGRINMETLSYAPTLIWFLDWSNMDSILDAFALIGLAISAFVLVTGCANMILMAAVWIIYLSLINVGQICFRSKIVFVFHKEKYFCLILIGIACSSNKEDVETLEKVQRRATRMNRGTGG